jgi:hypothetical protein
MNRYTREDLFGLGLAGGLFAFIAWGVTGVEPYAAAAIIALFAATFIVVAIAGAIFPRHEIAQVSPDNEPRAGLHASHNQRDRSAYDGTAGETCSKR